MIHTQNIGYKSDIGYQTFLYSNEHEIRRLLLYLVEQISTDSDEKSSSPDHPSATGWSIRPYDIIRRLKHSRPSTVWIPYSSDYIDDDDDESKYCPDSDYHDYYASITSPNSIYGMYNLNNYSLKSFLSSNSIGPLAEYCRINLNKGKMPIIPSTIIDILEWNNHFWKGNTADDDDDNNKNRQVDYMSHYFKTLCESKLTNAIVYHGGGEQSTNYVNSTIPSLMNVGGNVESNEQLSANPATDQVERKTNQQIILDKLRQELYECDSEIHQCKMNENELIRLEKEYQEKYKLFEASFRSKDEVFYFSLKLINF